MALSYHEMPADGQMMPESHARSSSAAPPAAIRFNQAANDAGQFEPQFLSRESRRHQIQSGGE